MSQSQPGIANEQESIAQLALSKINKYTIKAIKNLVNQEMKFFMQSETDLKDLTT
jgi:hypothetical protein